jgi:hypothetical protein
VRLFRVDESGVITESVDNISRAGGTLTLHLDHSPSFILTEIMAGDVTGTGELSATDAIQILRQLVELPNVIDNNAIALAAANITRSNDASVTAPNVNDAIAILRSLVGLPSALD